MPTDFKVNLNVPIQSEKGLQYAVIATFYSNHWIFVRHRDRDTWEIPGGHIEPGETPDQAASRELMEETGAVEFNIRQVSDYSVTVGEKTSFGRLYFAEIITLKELPDSEIAEISQHNNLPANLTYPLIQPLLFRTVLEYLKNNKLH